MHARSNFTTIKSAHTRLLLTFLLATQLCLWGCGGSSSSGGSPSPAAQKLPNIVFIVMDDVGIDQLSAFGWGGPIPPKTPNIDALANAGVKFTNTWVMAECSPSRTAFFTGRYALRTGVESALINNMLPASQTSPYEVTLPRVLANAGYKSAMVGKFHLGDQNPAGDCAPQTLGFDYFNGNLGASPGAIDTQAGDVNAAPGTYDCGFDQSGDPGACYQMDGSCATQTDGKSCLEADGLFVVDQPCQSTIPDNLDFTRTNSYYVWKETVESGALPPPTGLNQCTNEPEITRNYMTDSQTQSAIAWWNSEKGPRMISVTYNSQHTPFQQPPTNEVFVPSKLACQGTGTINVVSQRIIADGMLEEMDLEIGRLLAGMGLATLDANGVIQTTTDANGAHIPELERSNTMVVLIGDNGTFAPLVKQPFDANNSKGTVYQTGVWVPALAAGSLVKGKTGRSVDAMINAVDFFQLFADMAKVNVDTTVPPAHILDSEPMLPYLTNENQPPIRQYNFTQLGSGVFETPTNPATRSWPCVVFGDIVTQGETKLISGGGCSDTIFMNQSFCEQENNGIWFGPSSPDEPPLQIPNPNSADGSWNSCCDVINALNPSTSGITPVQEIPVEQWAIRNDRYKYIDLLLADCSKPLCPGPQCTTVFPPFERKTTIGFYDLMPTADNPAGLDCPEGDSDCTSNNLACPPGSSDYEACVPDNLKPTYEELQNKLNDLLASEPACPGDGNEDKFVNNFDSEGVTDFFGNNESFFDFNNDAKTNSADQAIVDQNFGMDCLNICIRADLNRDGVVNQLDAHILNRAVGKSCTLCGADLNGDGVVNGKDQSIMRSAEKSCDSSNASSGKTAPQTRGKTS
jgi:hypothetical protein